jgi:hypothetical protein
MTITVEVLSPDSIPALLSEASAIISQESVAGNISKDDGDEIKWSTKFSKPQEI